MKGLSLFLSIFCVAAVCAQNCSNTVFTSTALPRMGAVSGSCNFPSGFQTDSLVGLSTDLFGGASTCGECIEVTGPLGTTVVMVDTECSSCPINTLDISQDQFSVIADISGPNPTVTWKLTDCPVNGNVKILFNTGSNAWFLSFMVYNTRYPVSSVEYWTGSSYVELTRTAWNHYDTSLLVPAQLQFRITDVYGQQIVASGIPFVSGSTFTSSSQFPFCVNVGINDSSDNKSILLYPNPADNLLVLERDQADSWNSEVSIFDVSGRLVLEKVVKSDRLEINVESLPPGIYYLGYSAKQKTFYKKVIISR